LPDRLSLDPRSPHHDAALLERGGGIRFNGQERTNVEEYCISEGWIRVVVGKSLDRRGNPMTMKLKGQVEPYLLDEQASEGADAGEAGAGAWWRSTWATRSREGAAAAGAPGWPAPCRDCRRW